MKMWPESGTLGLGWGQFGGGLSLLEAIGGGQMSLPRVALAVGAAGPHSGGRAQGDAPEEPLLPGIPESGSGSTLSEGFLRLKNGFDSPVLQAVEFGEQPGSECSFILVGGI